jgi:hypothetical protein
MRFSVGAATAMAVLCLAASAAATPVTFGVSWDGKPPGTLSDVTGLHDFDLDQPAFVAGTWTITELGGYTAWWNLNEVGVSDVVLCDGTCTVVASQTLVLPAAWRLWATTPSYTLGHQFVWQQVGATTWTWGLEDITLAQSDADYQDVFGTVTFVGDPKCPDCVINPVDVVPEPNLLLVTGLLTAGLVRLRKAFAV